MLTLAVQNRPQKFKMFWNHRLQMNMRIKNVSGEPNFYSPLVQKLLLNVCVCVWSVGVK